MIEQQGNKLVLTFQSDQAATAFAQFLSTLLTLPGCRPGREGPGQPSQAGQTAPLASATSSPPSAPSLETMPARDPDQTSSQPPSLLLSRHAVLTPERQDQLFLSRQSGQTAHQRLLRAQTTLRDGVLPFSRPGEPPPPSGQPSPRQRAAQQGGFADGSGEQPEAERLAARGLARRRGSRLRPVLPVPLPLPSQPSPAK
jgi:hypothetical protein